MEFQTIEIKKLVPSDFNYRKTTDKDALDELTSSVRAKGVLQPILVRPLNGKHKGKFEIVAGHRRHQAAEAAGLKEMPAMVKALSDEESLEVQVIENTQREDPNPMDEAVGFKRLLEIGKHTPETLAARLDRSVGYVLSRVKLAELSKPVQAKIAAGELPLGIARLFTRLRNEGDQKKFLEEVTEDGGVSVRRAARMLDKYIQSLSSAPFDTTACGACPCNSGNQAALFPEIGKGDQCSDKSCFYTKSKKHFTDILKEKEKAGFKVFRKEDDVEKLVEYSGTGKTAQKIVALKKDADYSHEHPKKYKSECAGCTDHHAFYLCERTFYHGEKWLEFGEICLDRKCLDAMQRAGKKEERAAGESGKGPNPHTLRVKARECRDRFLLKSLLPKVGASVVLKQRLALHHIIEELTRTDGSWRDAFIKEYNPQYKGAGSYYSSDKVYRGIAGIPAARLEAAILHLVHETFSLTCRDVMLQMTPEAGIDMARDFAMDEEYLKGKTKDELNALAKELWRKDMPEALSAVLGKATAKKGDIIKAFLAQDLVGRVPKAIADVCKLDKKGSAAELDEDDTCDDCGGPWLECECAAGPFDIGEDPEEADKGTPWDSPEPAEASTQEDPTMPQPTVNKKRGKKAGAAKGAEA
ncbi:MAG: ParB/RepB/Spo0J family partition protein [Deltaproteobacteria bacterium]|nr:ParB/RepB/Spo0J family partition protein [Deltaproteobacteria bacterium]MCL4873838.1 ParB/RepB/Spo0J family partition protein [bacterium]